MKVRERIIQKIEKIGDEESLLLLEKWLDALSDVEENFTREEVNAVMDGYSQYTKGELLNEEEVTRYFEEWTKAK